MLVHERGDPRRMYIGGVGGLYRVFKYSGQWSEGVRQVNSRSVSDCVTVLLYPVVIIYQ